MCTLAAKYAVKQGHPNIKKLRHNAQYLSTVSDK